LKRLEEYFRRDVETAAESLDMLHRQPALSIHSDSRCAIAHVDHQPFVNPDASEDHRRLLLDSRIVKDLARLAIQQML
jgi:hypothetical protein